LHKETTWKEAIWRQTRRWIALKWLLWRWGLNMKKWIELDQDRVQWRSLTFMTINTSVV